MRLVSLLYIREGNRVLLGNKKVRFGAGYWNGFGGGVEAGETVEDSAVREVKEECGISVRREDLKKVAHVTFTFEQKPEFNHDVHVFMTDRFEGEPTETEEMRPQWHDINNLPLSEMWPSDPHWVPLVLKDGKTIQAECVFVGNEKPFPVGSFTYKEVAF